MFCSAVRPAVFQIQACQKKSEKSEMHRMTSDWLWTFNSKKYPLYIKYLPMRPKFLSVLFYAYGQPFSRYCTFQTNMQVHWTIEIKGVLLLSNSPTFQSILKLHMNFETSVYIDPQISLKHWMSKVSKRYDITTLKTHILIHFNLRLAFLKIFAIFILHMGNTNIQSFIEKKNSLMNMFNE